MTRLFLAAAATMLWCSCAGVNSVSTPDPVINRDRAYAIFIKAREFELVGNARAAAYGYGEVLKLDSTAHFVRFLLANHLYSLGKGEEAAAEMARAVKADTNFEYLSFYANLLYNLRKYAGAKAAFTEAGKLSPDDSWPREMLAEIHEKLGEYGPAAALYERLGKSGKGEGWRREKMTSLYLMSKDYEKALSLLRESLLSDPDPLNLRLNLMVLFEVHPDRGKVRALYRALLDAHPGHLPLRRDLGSLYFKAGNFAPAESVYRELVEKGGEFDDRKTLGIILSRGGKTAEAESVFTALLREKPDADAAFYLGNGHLAQGQYARAAESFGRCIALRPDYASAYVNRGVAFLRSEIFDSAVAVFEAMGKKFPESADAGYLLGTAFGYQKSYDRASEAYRRALSKSPGNVEILFNLAAAQERLGHFDSAVVIFEKAISRDSLHHRSLNYLGYMYAERGIRLDTAEAYLKRALRCDSANGAYLDSYGWVLYMKKDFRAARDYVYRAIEAREEDPVIFEHMALIEEALGDRDKASHYWKKLLELDPENEKAKGALAGAAPPRTP